MSQRRSGTIRLKVAGATQDASGEFSYNLGFPKRKAVMGADSRPKGFNEEGQVPFIEGKIMDRGNLDLKALVTGDDITVTLELAIGKVVVLRNAWYAGDGTGSTGDATIDVRWEGLSGEEIS